jgi:hypothetical protein
VPNFPVPSATGAPTEHADWLELEATGAADRNSSIQDLAGALRTGSSADDLSPEEAPNIEEAADFEPFALEETAGELTEPIAESAFAEVEHRSQSCGGAYPFRVGRYSLQGTTTLADSTYVFLLLLSVFGKDAGPPGLNVPQLFEEVSGVALANYLGGRRNAVETIQFGFPRRIGPPGFRDAVDHLCQKTGEGTGSKDRPKRRDQKDAALDLVAWRRFPDKRRGIVMAWGQCATGKDWPDKLTQLAPDDWAAAWLLERPLVLPLRAFLVPHRIDDRDWDLYTIRGGLLFDRCRIAALARPLPQELRERCRHFNRYVIAEDVR